jgi:hypothetical protein
MHREKFSMLLSICGLSAAGNWSFVPGGSRCTQASSAALSRELLTPSCCAVGNFPLPDGSGKFATPWERMQPANMRGSAEVVALPPFVAAAVVVVVPTLATFAVLGAAHAPSAIEAATMKTASPLDLRCFDALNRGTRGVQIKLLDILQNVPRALPSVRVAMRATVGSEEHARALE